jgi:quercetin dioxygenase-like cupin family protein
MSGPNPETGAVHELVSLYALNALDGSEKEIFEEHLQQGCPACEVDLRDFMFVARAIGRSASEEPPTRVRERLHSQLSLSPQVPGIVMRQGGLLISRSAELSWQILAPGITYKCLYEDTVRKYNTFLVRMEPGSRYHSHHHSDIEELLVLSGELHIEGRAMYTGDYCRAESGTIHGETYTNSGSVFLLLASQENKALCEEAF